jgi:hypothetical protein
MLTCGRSRQAKEKRSITFFRGARRVEFVAPGRAAAPPPGHRQID